MVDDEMKMWVVQKSQIHRALKKWKKKDVFLDFWIVYLPVFHSCTKMSNIYT